MKLHDVRNISKHISTIAYCRFPHDPTCMVGITKPAVGLVALAPVENSLYIRFKSGWLYRYDGVPNKIYKALMASESLGEYAQEHIYNAFTVHKYVGEGSWAPAGAKPSKKAV